MNIVYALMIVTSSGAMESPNPFNSYADCVVVSNKLSMNNISSYCVEKRPVDIEVEMNRMVALMKSMMNSMKEEQQ